MLTDTAVRQAKPKDKPYKIGDSAGLYLLIKPTGKYWRMNYRFAGKQKTLAIGVYPDISLKEARKKRDEAKEHLSNDTDPSLIKATKKEAVRHAAENSFKAIAFEWHKKLSKYLGRIYRARHQTLP